MSIDGTAIDAVAAYAQNALAAAGKVTKIDGVEYSTVPLLDVRKKDPEPAALTVSTLAGVGDYIRANRDGLPLEKCILHIDGPQSLSLYGPLQGHFQQRFHYLRAAAPDRLAAPSSFRFGQWMSHLDFVISAQALFTDTPERAALLQLLRRVKVEASVQLQDDGVTQEVQAKKGISMVESTEIKNPFMLAPYRTFAEITQPTSPFVLRARSDGESFSVALYEADGGAWKLEAINSIRTWLGIDLADEKAVLPVTIIG